MRLQAKVCDAADWFGGPLLRLIRSELRELPRFHRKQWELEMILRALGARHLDENWCYAALGKVRAGSGPLDAVKVLSRPGV